MDRSTMNGSVEKLVHEHLESLYRFAYRLTGSRADAEDLVQETFLSVHRNAHQLRDADKALPWLLTILRNCWSKQFKQQQTRMTETVCLEELTDDRSSVWLDELDKERLFAVINELPDQYREPLLLFYMHELRYRDIAEIVDCPIGTVMSRLARAKAYLRSRLVPEAVGTDRKPLSQGETHG